MSTHVADISPLASQSSAPVPQSSSPVVGSSPPASQIPSSAPQSSPPAYVPQISPPAPQIPSTHHVSQEGFMFVPGTLDQFLQGDVMVKVLKSPQLFDQFKSLLQRKLPPEYPWGRFEDVILDKLTLTSKGEEDLFFFPHTDLVRLVQQCSTHVMSDYKYEVLGKTLLKIALTPCFQQVVTRKDTLDALFLKPEESHVLHSRGSYLRGLRRYVYQSRSLAGLLLMYETYLTSVVVEGKKVVTQDIITSYVDMANFVFPAFQKPFYHPEDSRFSPENCHIQYHTLLEALVKPLIVLPTALYRHVNHQNVSDPVSCHIIDMIHNKEPGLTRIKTLANNQKGLGVFLHLDHKTTLEMIDTIADISYNSGRNTSKGNSNVSLNVLIDNIAVEDIITLRSPDKMTEKLRYLFGVVVIPDVFMERVIKDEDWHFIQHTSGSETWSHNYTERYNNLDRSLIVKTVKARELYHNLCFHMKTSGSPFLLFRNNVNICTPYGKIVNGTNLCTEIVQPTTNGFTNCVLGSINLPMCLKEDLISNTGKFGEKNLRLDITDDLPTWNTSLRDKDQTESSGQMSMCDKEQADPSVQISTCDEDRTKSSVKMSTCDKDRTDSSCDKEQADSSGQMSTCDKDRTDPSGQISTCDKDRTDPSVKMSTCDKDRTNPSYNKEQADLSVQMFMCDKFCPKKIYGACYMLCGILNYLMKTQEDAKQQGKDRDFPERSTFPGHTLGIGVQGWANATATANLRGDDIHLLTRVMMWIKESLLSVDVSNIFDIHTPEQEYLGIVNTNCHSSPVDISSARRRFLPEVTDKFYRNMIDSAQEILMELEDTCRKTQKVYRQVLTRRNKVNAKILALMPTATSATINGNYRSLESPPRPVSIIQGESSELVDYPPGLFASGPWKNLKDFQKSKPLNLLLQRDISVKTQIRIFAAVTRCIDQAASANIFPHTNTVPEVKDYVLLGWLYGLKTFYYTHTLRDEISTADVRSLLARSKVSCASCTD